MLAKTEGFTPTQTRLAALSKALSHPARVALLDLLANRTTCVCGELVDALPLAQASVSRHLKVLKEAGLIRGDVDGPRSCYCLAPDAADVVRTTIAPLLNALDTASSPDRCC